MISRPGLYPLAGARGRCPTVTAAVRSFEAFPLFSACIYLEKTGLKSGGSKTSKAPRDDALLRVRSRSCQGCTGAMNPAVRTIPWPGNRVWKTSRIDQRFDVGFQSGAVQGDGRRMPMFGPSALRNLPVDGRWDANPLVRPWRRHGDVATWPIVDLFSTAAMTVNRQHRQPVSRPRSHRSRRVPGIS
jgi:hypothetical protein